MVISHSYGPFAKREFTVKARKYTTHQLRKTNGKIPRQNRRVSSAPLFNHTRVDESRDVYKMYRLEREARVRTRAPDATERHSRRPANSGTRQRTVVYITGVINVLYPDEEKKNSQRRILKGNILSRSDGFNEISVVANEK